MSAFRVKSGTWDNPQNRSGSAERSGRRAAASVMEPTPAKPSIIKDHHDPDGGSGTAFVPVTSDRKVEPAMALEELRKRFQLVGMPELRDR
jgi:hypothetical protein